MKETQTTQEATQENSKQTRRTSELLTAVINGYGTVNCTQCELADLRNDLRVAIKALRPFQQRLGSSVESELLNLLSIVDGRREVYRYSDIYAYEITSAREQIHADKHAVDLLSARSEGRYISPNDLVFLIDLATRAKDACEALHAIVGTNNVVWFRGFVSDLLSSKLRREHVYCAVHDTEKVATSI